MQSMVKNAQMQIQQMSFMLIAVFIFFALVGMFFLRVQMGGIKSSSAELQRDQAISSLQVVADMPELNFDSKETMTLDADKLLIMSGGFGKKYESFWPVASIEVVKVYPLATTFIECPAANCNYYNIYNNSQVSSKKVSTFVSICKKERESGSVYDNRCNIGKLIIGVIENA